MNDKLFKQLDFDKVLLQFQALLKTEQGHNALSHVKPLTDKTKLSHQFGQLSELQALVQENGTLPLSETSDLTLILQRLKLSAPLVGKDFVKIKIFLRQARQLRDYFEQAVNVELVQLTPLIDKLQVPEQVQAALQIIEMSGHLIDDASPELAQLRREAKNLDFQTKKIMQESLVRYSKSLAESIITIRDGVQVLAIRAEDKNKVAGMVRDMSSSGQTVYIEPEKAAKINRQLTQKQLEIKLEETRVFRELATVIQAFVPDIEQDGWVLGQVDLLNAKYGYMRDYQAVVPELVDDHEIRLLGMRHPLIDQAQVVANDLLFDQGIDTIVITGPNTGGKTITMKTLGLLQLMAQSGLPILAASGSRLPIFDKIFADIGDEQSIEQNLSTFSSHMTSIIDMLSQINNKSLVLIDELGSGTDPKEGAALAIAILDHLQKNGVKSLVTSHYPELKAYGVTTPGVMNASMSFDLELLRPTYRLHVGVPGYSNAFDISRRLGLSQMIIAKASSQIDQGDHDVNQLIAQLEQQVDETKLKLATIRQLAKDNQELNQELRQVQQQLANDRDKLLAAAQLEAKQLLEQADESAKAILKDLDARASLKPHEVIAARTDLKALIPTVDLSKNKVLKKAKAKRGYKAGAEVLVHSYGVKGQLIKLERDGKWLVQMGMIQAKIEESDLEIITSDDNIPTKAKQHIKGKAVKHKGRSVSHAQLDLRGKRFEEAEKELDEFIDQALLSNLHQVTIVHGIGTGVIREMVTKYLQRSRHVASYNYAPQTAGGSGATIVTLK